MEFLKDIPQPLYKFRVWEEPIIEKQYSRRLLTDNEVYLASPDQFNDPFDTTVPFNYREEDLTNDNIIKKLSEVYRKNYPNISKASLSKICNEKLNSGTFKNGNYWKDFYPQYKQIMNKFGILSMTSKKDDLLMWSHYADSHRGFCVGIDKHILLKKSGGILGKVSNSNKFPKMELSDSPKDLFKPVYTKSKHWEYEDEYRLAKVEGAKEIVILPNEAILEIILGCKMLDKQKEKIFILAEKKFPNARIFETRTNEEEF